MGHPVACRCPPDSERSRRLAYQIRGPEGATMARNVEIKAPVTDAKAMRSRVESLGAAGPEELVQTDTFFNIPVGRLKLRQFGEGSGELIYYERPDAVGPKVSNYFRAPSADPASLRDVLAHAFGVRATVSKRRAVFLLGQTRIHLDDVDGLGSFIEFEVVLHDGQSVADGERIATSLMDALSVLSADLVPHAYVDLLESQMTR
jgi:predicted adenylyl cyclase CyaB